MDTAPLMVHLLSVINTVKRAQKALSSPAQAELEWIIKQAEAGRLNVSKSLIFYVYSEL